MAYTHWPNKDQENPVIKFHLDDKALFEIPLVKVIGCLPGRGDVTLTIKDDEEAPIQFAEMRLLVQDPNKGGEDADEDPVGSFCQAVKKVIGDDDEHRSIVAIDHVSLSVPRGRYDVKMSADSLSLHGRSYSYKIPFSNIKHIFQLPGKVEAVTIVLHVEPAVTQGGTRYQYLLMEFRDATESILDLQLSEEQLAVTYGGELQKEMEGPTYDLMSRVLHVLARQSIIVPGSFVSTANLQFIDCAHRQAQGALYPLERGIMAITKPPVYIPYTDVGSVSFDRSTYNTRSFDLEVKKKNGVTLTFTTINKAEHTNLSKFLRSKGVTVQGEDKAAKGKDDGVKEEQDSDDEDDAPDYNEDDEDDDGEEDDSDASME